MPFLCEVASHVKNCHFGHIILLLLFLIGNPVAWTRTTCRAQEDSLRFSYDPVKTPRVGREYKVDTAPYAWLPCRQYSLNADIGETSTQRLVLEHNRDYVQKTKLECYDMKCEAIVPRTGTTRKWREAQTVVCVLYGTDFILSLYRVHRPTK